MLTDGFKTDWTPHTAFKEKNLHLLALQVRINYSIYGHKKGQEYGGRYKCHNQAKSHSLSLSARDCYAITTQKKRAICVSRSIGKHWNNVCIDEIRFCHYYGLTLCCTSYERMRLFSLGAAGLEDRKKWRREAKIEEKKTGIEVWMSIPAIKVENRSSSIQGEEKHTTFTIPHPYRPNPYDHSLHHIGKTKPSANTFPFQKKQVNTREQNMKISVQQTIPQTLTFVYSLAKETSGTTLLFRWLHLLPTGKSRLCFRL